MSALTHRNPTRVNVVLGAHNLQTPEPTQQIFRIARLFENNYDPQQKLNDVLLLQVGGWGQQGLEVAVGSCCAPGVWDMAGIPMACWGDSHLPLFSMWDTCCLPTSAQLCPRTPALVQTWLLGEASPPPILE